MADERMGNTRRYRRQCIRIMVDYRTGEGICCDYATTVGAGGMFLETDEPMSTGAAIKVRFRLPDGEQLHELEGTVVWTQTACASGEAVRPTGVGIQFDDSDGVARLARELEDYDL